MFATDPEECERERLRQANAGHNLFFTCACVGVLIVCGIFGLALFFVASRESLHESDSPPSFSLYGRTLDDVEFDWESLRGKYVLVKFTATWCPPCKKEIPGMLDAYKKYHEKGLEIVSVYIWQDEQDPVSAVKRFVEKEKMPWIIISESLTVKAGQPPQGKAFDIQSVPTMLLVNREGKIHATNTSGTTLQRELQKLFGE